MKYRVTDFLPHNVNSEVRSDGSILLTSAYPLSDMSDTTGSWLRQWARERPGVVFLAERSGDGWREITYSEALQKVEAIASSLLSRGLDRNRPIAILSGNSINHALLSLAGQYVGIPVVPLSEQYSLISGAHNRLQYILNKTRPVIAYVEDAAMYGAALQLGELSGVEVIAGQTEGAPITVTPFTELLTGDNSIDLPGAHSAVTPDTLARIMFTSGSTSDPKGVCTTHKMLCANQTQIGQVFPILKNKPPKILDWLPWNHVFGGGHNFNLVLANGGSLYIDDGKPTPKDFGKTLRNLKEHPGNWSFNVPVGFEMFVAEFAKDRELRKSYFSDLDIIVYAGASLPQATWEGLEHAAMEEVGAVPMMISSWGMTETSPAALYVHEPIGRSGIVGVPLPGFTAKLIPDEEQRCELRVKGPNVTLGYFEDENKTREAFDEEGYFITGDAVRFVDGDNISAGLRFDGRISEDFKLLTGTWVQASVLRLRALEALPSFVQDIVICGQGRHEIGILIFPNMAALDRDGFEYFEENGVLAGARLILELQNSLQKLAETATGSSKRITKGLVLSDPPSLEFHEITGKGNLNAQKVQSRRAAMIERLYDESDPAVARLRTY